MYTDLQAKMPAQAPKAEPKPAEEEKPRETETDAGDTGF